MDQTLSKPTVELITQTQSFILADASQTLNLPNTVSQEINQPRPANPKSQTISQTQIQEIPTEPVDPLPKDQQKFLSMATILLRYNIFRANDVRV